MSLTSCLFSYPGDMTGAPGEAVCPALAIRPRQYCAATSESGELQGCIEGASVVRSLHIFPVEVARASAGEGVCRYEG